MLIVETGAGLPAAESLCSVAFADAYLASYGFPQWATMTTDEKEQALRRSTSFLQGEYRSAWAGYRASDQQALDWPRGGVPRRDGPSAWAYGQSWYADNVVPLEVQQACAKAAYKAAAGDLAPDQGQTKTRVKVGPIETEYAQGSTAKKRYPELDGLLRPFLRGGGGNSASVVRA